MSSVDVDSLTWPASRLGLALSQAARLLRPGAVLSDLANPAPDVTKDSSRDAEIGRWIESGARRLSLGLEPIDGGATTIEDLAPSGGATVLLLPRQAAQERRLVVLLGKKGHGVLVLARDGEVTNVTGDALEALDGRVFGVLARAVDAAEVLGLRGLSPERTALLRWSFRRRGRGQNPPEGWVLTPEADSFWLRARAAGVGGKLFVGGLAYLGQVACFAIAMWLAGKGALEGHLETSWLAAFALVLMIMVALRGFAASAFGQASIGIAGLARERLLEGILRLSSDEVRNRGVGQWLGLVMEVDALEAVARGGGLLAVAAVFDLILGVVAMALGAGGVLHIALMLLWLGVFAVCLARYRHRLTAWTDARLALTYDLVERMVGYRTLVVQGSAEERGRADADALTTYEERGTTLDKESAAFLSFIPRGWLVLGLAGLAPAFSGGAAHAGALAVGLGGLLLVRSAFQMLGEAGPALAAAAVAWARTGPLFRAANRSSDATADLVASSPDEAAVGRRGVLVGREVVFSYDGRPDPVLRGCSFEVQRGDRVLIEGESGSGKSTLGAVLSGLVPPSSGVLLLGGFDHHSLGLERWRQRSSGVPQFHANHVLASTLMFNLLFGRRWPARLDDIAEAEKVCRELGLDAVIARMPAGLQQIVGSSGWQLSHGERSRLFVARSLLQQVDVRVLDESLGALDPETMELALRCVLRRAETLVIIAHT